MYLTTTIASILCLCHPYSVPLVIYSFTCMFGRKASSNLIMSFYHFKVLSERERGRVAGRKRRLLSGKMALEPRQKPLKCHPDGGQSVRLETIAFGVLGRYDGDLWPREISETHCVVRRPFEEESWWEELREVVLAVVDINSDLYKLMILQANWSNTCTQRCHHWHIVTWGNPFHYFIRTTQTCGCQHIVPHEATPFIMPYVIHKHAQLSPYCTA